MAQTVFNGDLYVNGNLGGKTFTPPASSVTDAAVQALAGIAASKLIHANPGVTSALQLFGTAVSVAALTQTLGMAHAAGTLQAFGVWVEVAGSGGGMSATVDLQKSTAGGSYATVLSAVITLNASTVARILATGTLSSATYVAGDIFRIVVTATAGGGTLPTGLAAQLIAQEAAQ